MTWVLLSLFLLVLLTRSWLRWLNLRHLRRCGDVVPAAFAGAVDPERLRQAARYTVAKSRLDLVESLAGALLVGLFFFAGWLGVYDAWVDRLDLGFVAGGVVFFLGLALAQFVLGLPFSLLHNFVVERRFGFNAMGPGLWLSDQVKSLFLSLLLLAGVAAGALWLMRASPAWWWLWVWLFLLAAAVFLIYLAPRVIEPLFFKVEPLDDPELAAALKELLGQAGLRIERVFQVDASRRTRHSNAYFTGIGRVKRIVLFDTLLEQLQQEEILAVLAHEAGHWRLGHVRRRLLQAAATTLAGCLVAYGLIAWGGLGRLVGEGGLDVPAQLTVLFFLLSLAGFFLQPLFSQLSRRDEWQADRFAAGLTGRPEDMATALVKLSRDNLANLHPHPLYAWFYYSHPPVVARVARLQGA